MSMSDISHDGEPLAWQKTTAYTYGDGTIRACTSTNDGDDLGSPHNHAEWRDEFKTLRSFQENIGFCRTGISGVNVTVELDGVDFTKERFENLSKLMRSKSTNRKKIIDLGGR